MADGSISNASTEKFPAADAKGELNPAENKDFNVDSMSSQIATSQFIKAKEPVKKEDKKEKNDSMQTLKTAMIISAVVVAVAAAAFAIAKKLKEK